MASSPRASPDLVEVRRVPVVELEPAFELERRSWRERLGWEPVATADALCRAVDWGMVKGSLLRRPGAEPAWLVHHPAPRVTRLCGVHLPADLAARAARRGQADVDALVEAALVEVPKGCRVEGQLAAFEAQPLLDAAFARIGFVVEPREFLALDREIASKAKPRAGRVGAMEPGDIGACAKVLLAAHAGSVEARINDGFRSEHGANAYLRELAALGGCGRLAPWACVVVRRAGAIVGFCMATVTAPGVGHVPQIALVPEVQGKGLGTAMLRQAVASLLGSGLGRVTLSVSVSNERALAWYRGLGFAPLTTFASYHRDPPG